VDAKVEGPIHASSETRILSLIRQPRTWQYILPGGKSFLAFSFSCLWLEQSEGDDESVVGFFCLPTLRVHHYSHSLSSFSCVHRTVKETQVEVVSG